MRENFEFVKENADIEYIARYLLGEPVRGMYRFPGERTASIKIYPRSGSFFDFGRSVGGDAVRLWSHVRGIDNWHALSELRSLLGITSADGKNIGEEIKRQEKAQKAARRAEKERKRRWRNEVDFWERVSEVCGDIAARCAPLSDAWKFAKEQGQLAEYRLDCLCLGRERNRT